ncbi:hypothetical protein JVT61DRAFT_1759 [Boletus reticuloceps]|uniref:CUE domain-containing protein n=1 Tax=Boletus reticuloceps TaxID=495285 RepID=A0A8I3A9F7_9AGAM|nr:hypothetical protein JVT61DRAFT_1759 [Boletus reticuloceps]
MSEVVNVLVAFAVIVFIFRWATSGPSTSSSDARSATAALGFRPKHVTQDMVDQIHTMFPDIPTDNIRFDLLRTGSVELTSNKILERGFLEPPPPAYFTLYPRPDGQTNERRPPTTRQNPTPASTTARPASLIERYHLAQDVTEESNASDPALIDAGGKAKWEDTPEKREASLRERKAQMVLAARQRMLAQQQKEGSGSGSS